MYNIGMQGASNIETLGEQSLDSFVNALVLFFLTIFWVEFSGNSHELGSVQPSESTHRVQIDLQLLAEVSCLTDRPCHPAQTI